MHGTTRTRRHREHTGSGVNAVVWIDRGRALIIRGTATGEPASLELPIPQRSTDTTPVLAEIAHRIGDVDRVVVLGSDDLRTALEREIVAIGHRPESIRDESAPNSVEVASLVARLRRLA